MSICIIGGMYVGIFHKNRNIQKPYGPFQQESNTGTHLTYHDNFHGFYFWGFSLVGFEREDKNYIFQMSNKPMKLTLRVIFQGCKLIVNTYIIVLSCEGGNL